MRVCVRASISVLVIKMSSFSSPNVVSFRIPLGTLRLPPFGMISCRLFNGILLPQTNDKKLAASFIYDFEINS